MSTPDYTAQATALLADAPVHGPREGWGDPIWTVDLTDALNLTVDVGGATEADARAAVVDHVADVLRRRDPGYVAPSAPPAAADVVLAALSSLDPQAASTADVIQAVTGALSAAGATPVAVPPA